MLKTCSEWFRVYIIINRITEWHIIIISSFGFLAFIEPIYLLLCLNQSRLKDNGAAIQNVFLVFLENLGFRTYSVYEREGRGLKQTKSLYYTPKVNLIGPVYFVSMHFLSFICSFLSRWTSIWSCSTGVHEDVVSGGHKVCWSAVIHQRDMDSMVQEIKQIQVRCHDCIFENHIFKVFNSINFVFFCSTLSNSL